MPEEKKEEIQLEIGHGGVIRSIYRDSLQDLAQSIGGKIEDVCRASNVEWETVEKPLNARFPATKGWSVRSAHDPELALRWESSLNAGIGERYIDTIVVSKNPHLAIVLFDEREKAIEYEVKHFWELIPKKGTEANGK